MSAWWPVTWRVVLSGACEQHWAINSRTESQKTSSISKPAVKWVSNLAFLSKSRSAECGRQVNPGTVTQSAAVLRKEGEGERCEVPVGTTECWSESRAAVFLLPESEATDTWDKDKEAEMLTLMVCHRVSSVSGGGGGSICEREGSSNHQHRKCHFFKLIISMHR